MRRRCLSGPWKPPALRAVRLRQAPEVTVSRALRARRGQAGRVSLSVVALKVVGQTVKAVLTRLQLVRRLPVALQSLRAVAEAVVVAVVAVVSSRCQITPTWCRRSTQCL